MKKIIFFYLSILTLFIAGCSPSTVITGSWKSPNATSMKGKYHHIFITAMISETDIRSKLENAISQRAKSRGLETTQSLDVFPPGFKKSDIPDKEKLLSIIRDTKSDVILTVAVKSVKEETHYVQGSGQMYAPYPRYGYYGGFSGYYGSTYYDGYYTTDQIIFLETNIYDVKSEGLIWSAQSKTTNVADFETFSREYLYVILDRLQKDGLIDNGNPKK